MPRCESLILLIDIHLIEKRCVHIDYRHGSDVASPNLLHRSNPKEAPMPTTYAKIFDRVALSFFTALAMFPVLTVALGGVFH
jgi:hypothetical protein